VVILLFGCIANPDGKIQRLGEISKCERSLQEAHTILLDDLPLG
jgi:hypothetical protein